MQMIMLTITFCSFTESYWTMYALQTNNNYTLSFEYHNLHIFVFTSSCSWYEFHVEIFKHITEQHITPHFKWVFVRIQICIKKKYANIRIQTCICDLCSNASLPPYQLVYQWILTSTQSTLFTFILPWNLVTSPGKVMLFFKLGRHIDVFANKTSGINNCN
jgi:hypothetical protein